MSQSTKIFVGVVILAGLGGAIYYAQNKDKQIGTSSVTSADLPEIKAPDDVDKVQITNGDKGDVVLEKKDNKWVVSKPVQAAANQGNVDQLVKNLKDLKAKEVITMTPSEDSKKDYDFTPAKQVHVMAWKGGDTGNAKGGPAHLHFETKPTGGKPMNPYPAVLAACKR